MVQAPLVTVLPDSNSNPSAQIILQCLETRGTSKVKLSRYRPGVAQRDPGS